MDLDPLEVDWTPDQVAVMQRLRDWATLFAELNQRLAAWMRLPGSDATALGHVIWAAQDGRPLSPVELARRIGLSSGATTALLNRLEAAGLVRRTRDQVDRRRVTLRPEPAALEQARAFLAVAGPDVAEIVLGTPPADLVVVVDFLARIGGATDRAAERLRVQTEGARGTAPRPEGS